MLVFHECRAPVGPEMALLPQLCSASEVNSQSVIVRQRRSFPDKTPQISVQLRLPGQKIQAFHSKLTAVTA